MSSCKKKGCTDEQATNYEEKAKKDDGSCVYDDSYDVPDTYTFKDENGNSTVDFSGQTQRMAMLEEMTNYMKTANTKGTEIEAATLKSMYDNTYTGWNDSDNLGLVGSSKQLKSKTAGGDAVITTLFESYMDSIAALSKLNMDGSAGQSGVYPNDGNKGPYLMDANGLEYTQWIEKGLMCAVFYHQISQVYLGDDKMNVDNTTAVDAENGKYYTTMEHHWDEAFGYFTDATDYPANGTDRFWGKYASGRETQLNSATNIMDAFIKGRAAISNDDLTTRDEQIIIIRTEMERMIAGTAIHYLNDAIENISLNTTRNHALSEATAFIKGLQYGYESTISATEINTIIDTIGDDYNNVSVADLNSAKNSLSSIMGLDDVKDQL